MVVIRCQVEFRHTLSPYMASDSYARCLRWTVYLELVSFIFLPAFGYSIYAAQYHLQKSRLSPDGFRHTCNQLSGPRQLSIKTVSTHLVHTRQDEVRHWKVVQHWRRIIHLWFFYMEPGQYLLRYSHPLESVYWLAPCFFPRRYA